MTNDSIENVKVLLDQVISTFSRVELKGTNLTTFQLRDAELKLRRNRDKHFPAHYFNGSIWDVLLELDRAARQGLTFVVSDVGIAANIPPTTALRYLCILDADQLIVRTPDPKDRRRVIVSLTAKGRAAMDQSFNDTIRQMTPQHEGQIGQLRAA